MLKRESARLAHRHSITLLRVLAIICVWVHSSLGVTNSLTVTEKDGNTTTNYPVQIGRPFVQGEIANFPQAIVGGSAVTTQADVKARWPDGSVKHAILTFLIPTLTANASVTVTFRNQSSGNSAGFQTQENMLGADYDFDARMELVNGAETRTASARTMLQAGAFTYWLQGSVATSVIIADHSAARAYDVGFDAHRSFRPIFHATFWPGINKVRVRFIGEIANTEALQDQVYALTLKTGFASPATVYTKSTFTHLGRSRWTKEFWIGGAPPAVAINHNLPYLAETTLIPNYDTSKVVSESAIASAYAQWTNAPKDLYDAGNWTKSMGTTGGRADIGPYPTWTVRWLYTGDRRMREQAFGNADLAGAWPLHYREGNATKWFDRAQTVPGLGRVISISSRQTLSFVVGLTYSATRAEHKVVPVGLLTTAGWLPDTAHQPEAFSPQYMLTGDHWYLEQMYFWSAWNAGYPDGSATSGSARSGAGRGPTGGEGGIAGQPRGEAWMLRSRVNTASVAPDGSAEKSYFETLINDAVAIWEGQRDVTGSAFKDTANWKWGKATGQWFSHASSTWNNCSVAGSYRCGKNIWFQLTTPPLRHWASGNATLVSDPPLNSVLVSGADQQWQYGFVMWALGRGKELGYPLGPLVTWFSWQIINCVTNPDYSPYLMASYRLPSVAVGPPEVYFQTWADLRDAYRTASSPPTCSNNPAQVCNADLDCAPGLCVARGFDAEQTFTRSLNNADHGYAFLAMIGTGAAAAEPGGAAAWDWMATNVLTAPTLNDSPKWAIVPRVVTRPGPPHLF